MWWLSFICFISRIYISKGAANCPPLSYNAATTHIGTDFKTFALIRCKDGHELADKSISKELQCVDGEWSDAVPICFGPGRVVARRDISSNEEEPPTPDPNDGCKWESWSEWSNCTGTCAGSNTQGVQSRSRVVIGQLTDDECEDWKMKHALIHSRPCTCSTRKSPIEPSTNTINKITTIEPTTTTTIVSFNSNSTVPHTTTTKLSTRISTKLSTPTSTKLSTSTPTTFNPTYTLPTLITKTSGIPSAHLSSTITSTKPSATTTSPSIIAGFESTTTVSPTTQYSDQPTTSFWGPWSSFTGCKNISFDSMTQIITYNPPMMTVGTKAYITCRENMYLTNGQKFDVLTCLRGGVWDKGPPFPCTYNRPTQLPSEGCKVEPCPTADPNEIFNGGNGEDGGNGNYGGNGDDDECEDPCPDPDPSCIQPYRNKCSKPCVPCSPNYCRSQCFKECDDRGRETDPNRCRASCDDRCEEHCRTTFRKCVDDCQSSDETCQRRCNEKYTERGCDPLDRECDSYRKYQYACEPQDRDCADKWQNSRRNRGCLDIDLNCELSLWSEWGSCSASCSGGCKYRLREVVQYGSGRGSTCQCESLVEKENCNVGVSCEPDCDCEWDQWSHWSTCSATCNEGVKKRSRAVLKPKQGRGRACPGPDSQTEVCSSGRACCTPRDCQWASWSPWGQCSVSCGYNGEMTRHRSIAERNNECGQECDYTERLQRRECPYVKCSVDCIFQWASWSHCSVTCGTGVRTRSAHIQRQSENGGRACPSMETDSCHISEENAPIEYGSWAEWGPCSATCDDYPQSVTPPSQTRYRTATRCGKPIAVGGIQPLPGINGILTNIGGSIPQHSSDTRACQNLQPCECEWSPWGYWGRCSATCGSGTQERSRYITKQGISCPGSDLERQSCPQLAQCCQFQEWGSWSSCSVSCGSGGRRSKVRYGWPEQACRQQYGSGGEKQEEYDNCPYQPNCIPQEPIRNCVWSKWGDWSPCSEDCGIGTQIRRRYVAVQASKRGQYCVGNYEEVKQCDTTLPPRECPPIVTRSRTRYGTGRRSAIYKKRPCKYYCRRNLRRRRAICENNCQKMELFAPRYEEFVEHMKNETIQNHIRIVSKNSEIAGKNMKLLCDTDIPYLEDMKEQIIWLQDGSFCKIHRRRKQLHDGSLLIRGVRSGDSGTYTCAIASSSKVNVQGIVAVSEPFTVRVKGSRVRRLCEDKVTCKSGEVTDDLCRKRSYRKSCCLSCKKLRTLTEKLINESESD